MSLNPVWGILHRYYEQTLPLLGGFLSRGFLFVQNFIVVQKYIKFLEYLASILKDSYFENSVSLQSDVRFIFVFCM